MGTLTERHELRRQFSTFAEYGLVALAFTAALISGAAILNLSGYPPPGILWLAFWILLLVPPPVVLVVAAWRAGAVGLAGASLGLVVGAVIYDLAIGSDDAARAFIWWHGFWLVAVWAGLAIRRASRFARPADNDSAAIDDSPADPEEVARTVDRLPTMPRPTEAPAILFGMTVGGAVGLVIGLWAHDNDAAPLIDAVIGMVIGAFVGAALV